MPERHQVFLEKYRFGLNRIREAIETNYHVIQDILSTVDNLFLNEDHTYKEHGDRVSKIRSQDIEKVQITLKQIARDWSSDGEAEREQCYKPIIEAVVKHFDPNTRDISKVKILLPGAGLGRLLYELALIGYDVEGNEFSLFMLIASNFILNRCLVSNEHQIYPYVHQYVNNLNRNDQIRSINFPDQSPTQQRIKGNLAMVAGDFLEVYQDKNTWDCVATCFFIDCAKNVAEFIETIYNILKPGGIWINIGPLLYHYSDIPGECSIEPSFEDIKIVISAVGFEFMTCETGVATSYAQNPRAMMKNVYESVFFVCQKPENIDDNESPEY